MSLGIKFWYWIKIFQIKKNKPEIQRSQNVLYVGSDNNIYTALQKVYNIENIYLFAVCETRVISRFDDLEKLKKIIDEKGIEELVFDNQSNTFSKIIFYMNALHGRGLLFKIRPENKSFIIGSNNSNDRGSVIQLEL